MFVTKLFCLSKEHTSLTELHCEMVKPFLPVFIPDFRESGKRRMVKILLLLILWLILINICT